MDDQLLSRRQFTRESVMALLSGVVITITGCGSDSSSPTAPSTGGGGGNGGGGAGDVNGTISANHGHIATVTDVQINGGKRCGDRHHGKRRPFPHREFNGRRAHSDWGRPTGAGDLDEQRLA